jgi:queuine/archaeosine tRNA-ribosyltransferase
MKSIQLIVTLESGVLLKGDIFTREEFMRKDATLDTNDGSFEDLVEKFVNIAKQINNLEHFSITRQGQEVFINPKKILYIEVVRK